MKTRKFENLPKFLPTIARRYLIFLYFASCGLAVCGQESAHDTLDIKYYLIENTYAQYEDIVKIKLPPYLSTAEVMRQIQLAVQWPGDPPPSKRTKVYVFREDAVIGDRSSMGAVYFPGRGFQWQLAEWRPDLTIYRYRPRASDKVLYNTLLDSLFAGNMFASEYSTEPKSGSKIQFRRKENVADLFEVSISEMDSIYFRVKWWLDLNPNEKRVQR